MPRRVAGYRSILKFLPTAFTKKSIYVEYKQTCMDLKQNDASLLTGIPLDLVLMLQRYCDSTVSIRLVCILSSIFHQSIQFKWKKRRRKITNYRVKEMLLQYAFFFLTLRILVILFSYRLVTDHLSTVDYERKRYNTMIQDSRHDLMNVKAELVREEINLNPGSNTLSSYNVESHISFDFAQQVFLPNDPQQVGPLYFLTPYKVSIFGLMNDTFLR